MGENIWYTAQRKQMVERQIGMRGVSDPLVLDAMRRVPRHLFVPENLQDDAYDDCPLPIGHGATISQPYIVGLMTALIEPKPGDRVLEVGAGSGYQAAILAEIGCKVTAVERIPELSDLAEENLKKADVKNVTIITGNGTALPEVEGPFDGIIITAAAPDVPPSLTALLADGGRMAIPVGDMDVQVLTCIHKKGDSLTVSHHGAVRFVPLIGNEGWSHS
ncbi:protein-L-isoaspartate(D-aspartate) O-methyltransferase [Methanogenium organophilum]|uniref:Protein-L-isoaspartate O-methyltransferase n=1 Tax=Methanogenium organophilum TaxID=2199 RepID=A0A9X9S237_METOG|nr:protein-L-isoaspartate(D-aspartate) O-methyltransferase [Methanogenium organophilum]WAI00423.1 protein-L-isoaspartate(D-aspartate) O-methyltransferase [Methanogenium organophilum]